MSSATASYRFESFELRPHSRELLAAGQPAKLGARAFDVLLALVERRDRLVSKNELLDLVWPNLTVEEGNLAVQIGALRKLLGVGSIATVPGRGYKFSATLQGLALQGADEALRAPANAAAHAAAGNLPARLPPLYGRQRDVLAIGALLGEHRLVCVVGPGGIGKTRVAHEVGSALREGERDGAWLVELAPLVDADLVVATLARALGQPIGPRETPGALADAMAAMRLLLVLDNCEHVAGAVAALAKAILARAPGVRLLVTSQEPLHLPEEQVYRLGPLGVPLEAELATAPAYGAVALFTARAQAANARFTLDEDNVGAVVDICARLDGIALAIELAAARVPLLGVQGLRKRLDERLRLLSDANPTALRRHRTLRAALEWSCGLLSDDEGGVLDRLGVFAGGFSLEAAQRVAADGDVDEWAALDRLSTLVDKSLVMVEPGDPPRYQLLETTRAFALERLAASGGLEAARRRHAEAMVAAFRAVGVIQGPSARLAATARELDNLRAAAAWACGPGGDHALAVALAGEGDFIWNARSAVDEGVKLSRLVEPWVADAPPAAAARFWLTRSALLTLSLEKEQIAAAAEAARLYAEMGDVEGQFVALTFHAMQRALAGDRAEAIGPLAKARALHRTQWPAWTAARLEMIGGYCKFFCESDLDGAAKSLRLARDLLMGPGGDVGFAGNADSVLVLIEFSQGHFEEAARLAGELLQRPEAGLAGYAKALVAIVMGAALAGAGDLAASEAAFRRVMPGIKRATGRLRWALVHAVILVAKLGRHADAAQLIGYIDATSAGAAMVRHPPQRLCYEVAAAIVAPALGAAEFGRLKALGAALSEDEALGLALPGVD